MKHTSQLESVTFWLNKAAGSETTRREYKNRIKGFFEAANVNPDALVSEWEKIETYGQERRFLRKWTKKIEAYVYALEGYAPTTVMQELTIVVSFFKHHGIEVKPSRKKHVYVTYHNRDITKEEIRRILERASIRDKAFFLAMAESGLRPYTLVQLRYKHIKKDFEAGKVPMRIELPSKLLKDRVEARWTFIGQDGFKALKSYLDTRGKLYNDSLVFAPERSDLKHSFVCPESFTKKFSNIAMKLGITERIEKGKPKDVRLYCLRKFFNDNLRYEGFNVAYREFWMCHKTTQTHYISRDPEKHREEYAVAYQNLRIYARSEEEKLKERVKEIENFYKLEMDRGIVSLQKQIEQLRKEMQKES